jgi:protein-tyrosine phosphatase
LTQEFDNPKPIAAGPPLPVVASGLVDIHSHILPGLDDGSQSLEDSVAMLRLAADSGTTDIVATPHANSEFTFNPEVISEKIAELQAAAGPVPRIHRGCDFHLTLENIQDALANPGKYAINHLCYLLVEFSDLLIPRTTQDIFDRLQSAGLTPIITHPERNGLLHTRLDQLQTWVENGALVQVTGGSLLGTFGRTARSVATELMNRNLVHFIASDAHDTKYRTPMLRDAYLHVEKTWGQPLAETLFTLAPGAVIAGEEIQLSDADPLPKKKKWFRFGF